MQLSPGRNPAWTISKRIGRLGGLRDNSLAGMARRQVMLAYLFLLPTIAGIFLFVAGPVVVSFGLSVFRWDIIHSPTFIGTENYRRLFHDQEVLTSFINTAKFMLFAVGIQLVLGLLLALAVQSKIPRGLRYFFRTAFFLPLLTSGATISIVLTYLFNSDFGAINYYLGKLGVSPIPWLTSSS